MTTYEKLGYLVWSILGWIFGITLIFGGIAELSNGRWYSVIFFITGLLLIPKSRRWILSKIKYPLKPIRVIVGSTVVAMATMANTAPKPNEQPKALLNNQSNIVTEAKDTKTEPAVTTIPQTTVPTNVSTRLPVAVQDATKAAVASQPLKADYTLSCKVVAVTDGDTFTCLTADKNQLKIRMNQIDAPEKTQDFGEASKKALSGYIFGKTVNLITTEKDKYGRTVAEVYLDNKNINKAMVADGMAWAYREYMRDQEYENLENNARSKTQGLWSQPNPIYPSDFRRGKRGQQATPIQTQTITKQVEHKAIASSGGECGSKRYCKEMTSCAEARHYLNDCGVYRLDRDSDGIPCESICR